MSDSLMTEATQTNEADTQQTVDATTEATTVTEQQTENVQDQQDSDESSVESKTSEQETPKKVHLRITSLILRWLTHLMNSTPK